MDADEKEKESGRESHQDGRYTPIVQIPEWKEDQD
jgi:hypothetical protein